MLKLPVYFLSALMIIGLYLGYFYGFTQVTSIIAIILSALFSVTLFYFSNIKSNIIKKFPRKKQVLLILIFALVFAFLVYPEGVFPVTCSDFMNHSLNTRLVADNGLLPQNIIDGTDSAQGLYILSHHYPQGYYAITSQLYTIISDAYLINTLFIIAILLLTLVFIYEITMKLTLNENVALIAMFIAFFSITNLWIFEHGFLPQILGTLFILSAFYAYITQEKILWLLSCIGMIVYPPLIAVLLLFLFVDILSKRIKNKESFLSSSRDVFIYFILFIVAMLIIFPETIGLLLNYIDINFAKDNIFLVRGGIYTPNFFGLLPFVFSIPLLFFIKKKKQLINNQLFLLLLSSLIMSGVIVVYYLSNMIFSFSFKTELTAMYLAVKFFYFALIPLAIFSAMGIQMLVKKFNFKWLKIIIVIIFLFELLYFIGYFPVLYQKDSEPLGYYVVAEFVNDLPIGSVVGIDSTMIIFPKIESPIIYASLINNPDPDGPNLCRNVEATRAFQFSWAYHESAPDRFRIYDENGKEVLLLGDMINPDYNNIDYFVSTNGDLSLKKIFSSYEVSVYQIK